MAWTEPYSGSASIGGTEYSLTDSSATIASRTTKGTYQVVVDASALQVGDRYRVRVLEKCRASGTQRQLATSVIAGPVSDLWMSPAMMLGNGWDVTVQKLAGADRTLEWSIRAYE